MKAATVHRYGPPENVRIEEVPRPTPRAGEVLIRMKAVTVTSADYRLRAMDVPRGLGPMVRLAYGLRGLRKPILGSEGAGVVAETGPGVTQWRKGDQVIVFAGMRLGLHAEYACLPETAAIVRKPDNLSFAQAAALPFGGTTALYFLHDRAALRARDRVLVTGAAGAVGSAAAQIARAKGAQVTVMCSADKAPALAALGLTDHIASGGPMPAGTNWDLIVDAAGIVHRAEAGAWLAPAGRLCQVLADVPQMLGVILWRLGKGRRILGGVAPERVEDVQTLAEMAADGRLRPLIGAQMPFDRIAEAHALAESRHKLGSTVLELAD